MPEKEPTNTSWLIQLVPYMLACTLSCAGGMVAYFQRMNKHKLAFNLFKFSLETATSAFVGLITFLLCDIADMGWQATAIILSICGHRSAQVLSLYSDTVFEALEVFVKTSLRRFTNGTDSKAETGRKKQTRKQAEKPSEREISKDA